MHYVRCTFHIGLCSLNSAFLYILYLNTLWLELNPLNLELFNLAKNFPVVLPRLPIKFEANRSSGSWVMIGQTIKQTNRQTEITTLYIYKSDVENVSYCNIKF